MQYNSQMWLESQHEMCYSMDLDEATYRISQDTLEENYLFLEDAFFGNPLWEVYGDLFKITERELDLSLIKQQGYDVPELIEVRQGSFMGDGLSFMHLTLMLSAVVNLAACEDRKLLTKEVINRPFGQSVGDDLVIFNARKEHAERIDYWLIELGAKRSKINSYFENGVFAEQYFAKVLHEGDRKRLHPDSLFGDIWYVDSIKVTLLTGKPKVSAEKRNSFIGQANSLGRQMQYLMPGQSWKRLRCRVYLWVANYDEAVRLGRAKPHLPNSLGGLEVPIGACDPPDSILMQEKYMPYFTAMLSLDQKPFMAYYLLLKGIFRSTPKGVPWSNDPDRVYEFTKNCEIVPMETISAAITEPFYHRLGNLEKLRYLKRSYGWISASEIDTELSRRETYLEFWYNPEQRREFRTLKTSSATARHNLVWEYIRRTLPKVEVPFYLKGPGAFQYLNSQFGQRTWGFFINQDDPSIQEVYEGNTSLFFEFSD